MTARAWTTTAERPATRGIMRLRWGLPLLLVLPLALAAGDDLRPDPVPLRRIQIGPERIAQELERAQKGALVLLPREEFENKVQQAARAQDQAANPPRLAKTVYTAQLVGQALVGGAEWTVVHVAPGPGLLPLGDFNLALGKRVKVNAADGILGEIDGKTQSLWIDQPGQPSVFFDWTRRGTQTADGLHFDLEVPACASAHLELTLPATSQLVANKPGLLVTGPLPAADAGQRTWKLGFSGRSRVEFAVRNLDGGAPLLVATLVSRQELGPERVLADFDFQIEAVAGSTSELVFDGDAPLTPFDVTLGGMEVKGWRWRPRGQGKSTSGGELVVPLPTALTGALPVLQVRCLAPALLDKGTWTSPSLRLRGSLSRGETLKLIAPPEAQLDSWRPGNFRLTKAVESTDGTQTLTLVRGGWNLPRPPASLTDPAQIAAYAAGQAALTPLPQRPSAVPRARTTELLIQQTSWWQIDVAGSVLTCELLCLPSRGRLYHLPLKLPADCQVEQLQAEPRECLGSWAVAGGQSPVLLIDLAQPATPQTPVRIQLQLRLPLRASAVGGVTLPLPDVEPLVRCLREGSLAVSVHPHWRAEIPQASIPSTVAPVDEGRWQKALPDYFFAFRKSALTGSIRLNAQAPQFHARLGSEVFLGNSRGLISTRLTLEPTTGSLDHVDLLLPAPVAELWKVKSETPGTHLGPVQRLDGIDLNACLLMLGAGEPLKALSAAALRQGSQRWRIRFSEPIRGRTTLLLEAPFDPVGPAAQARTAERAWAIPVPTVVGAATSDDASLAVQLRGPEFLDAQLPPELKAMPRAAAPSVGSQQLWRVFGYDGSRALSSAPLLRVKIRQGVELPAQGSCDTAALTSYVEAGDRQVHHFHFRVWNWHKKDLPVLLPTDATLLAARTEGRWLADVGQHATADGLQVDLRSSALPGVQHFDLYYTTPSGLSSWAAWDTLETAAPQLPVGKPLDLRRTWVLPPGVVPLGGAWRRQVGQPAGHGLGLATLGQTAWHAGQPLLDRLLADESAPPWVTSQRQQLGAAETALRKQWGPESGWALGPALESLTFEHMPQVPVAVDIEALSAAGLSVLSSFARGAVQVGEDPWSRLQAIFVPTPAGLLLTTRGQWQEWGGGDFAAAGTPLADAVAETVQAGHDVTGRFFTAGQWLRGGIYQPATGQEKTPTRIALQPQNFGPDWTLWDASAGTDVTQALVVVRPVAIRAAGMLLSFLLAAIWFGSAARWPRHRLWRVRFLLVAAAVAALAWLAAPPVFRAAAALPVLTALLLLVGSYCAALLPGRRALPASPSSLGRAAAAVVLLTLCGGALGLPLVGAQGQEASTVLVLPGPADAPQRQDVLVPPELLKRLDGIIRRGPADARGAVLVSANYEIKLQGPLALCKAEYQVWSFGEKATLTVPLGGIELRDGALLDGAAVQPATAGNGYAVPIQGRGAHRLTLFFGVRLQTSADHRDLRFAVPRVLQSQLHVEMPMAWPETQVASTFGMTQAATLDAQTRSLVVDLGREATVHLRWAARDPAAAAAKIAVRELYWWDLRVPDSECTALLEYKVSGAISHLVVALPDTLEPRGVEVSGDGPGGDEASRPRLKRWYLAADNGQWRLHIDLQNPASGEVAVALRLVPRAPGGLVSGRLPLPLPLGASMTEGAVAFRVDGGEARGKGYGMATQTLRPEQFAKLWQAGAHEPALPTEAFTFRNRQSDAGLVLTLSAARPAIEQELQWTVHPDRVDLLGTLKSIAAGADLLFVEWEVPQSVTVAQLAGDNVRAWTRPAGDNRVQVWLKQPAKTVTLQVRGWTLLGKGQPGQALRWTLPCLRYNDAASSRTVIRLVESEGVRLEADAKQLTNLVALPGEQAWVCQVAHGYYRAEFLRRLVPLPTRVLAVTSVDARDGAVHLAGSWQVQIPHGEATAFEIRVAGWPAAALTLEAPSELKIAKLLPVAGEQGWKVSVAAGAPRRFQLKLAGKRPAGAGAAIDLPAIRLEQAQWSEQWLIVHGPDVEVQSSSGLVAVKDNAGVLPPSLPERMPAGAELWKAVEPAWKMRLVAKAATTAADLQVLFGSQETAFGEGFGWLHQAFYLIYAKDSYELILDLPPGATYLAAAVNGEQVTPRFLTEDRLALPLTAGESVQRVRLRWVFGQEPFDRPRLTAPRLEAAPTLALYHTITVPPGYRLAPDAAPRPGEAGLQDLARAEALGTALRLLVEQYQKAPADSLKSQILSCQKRFMGRYRTAAHEVQTAAGKDRLEEARRTNAKALREAGLEKVRALAEKVDLGADREPGPWLLPSRGQVTQWSSGPAVLDLVSVRAESEQRAWFGAEVVLAALVILLTLTALPRVASALAACWPEQLLLVALAGWLLWGFSLVGAVLVATALAARSILTARRLLARIASARLAK